MSATGARVKERSLTTRPAGAQGGDPAFVSFSLLPLALVAPSFRRTRPSSHRLSIAPAGRGIDANKHLCVAFRLFRDNQRLLRGSPTMIGGGSDHE
jgi:hypothetical protein